MTNAERMAARRVQLKKDSRCHDCARPIDLAKGVRCPDCKEKNRDRKRLWESTERGKKITSRRTRLDRRRRRRRGLCCDCNQRAVRGRTRCAAHLAANKERQSRYQDRKEAGIKIAPREATIVPVPELSPQQRVLRIATRFDVVTRADICDVLGTPDEHSAISHIFRRLERKGFLRVVRASGSDHAYAVTPEGRRAA